MGRVMRLLVAAAIALPLLVATGGRAVACTCAPLGPAKTIHRADAIVAGRVVEQIALDPLTTQSTVRVTGVYKGHVRSEITVMAAIGSGGGSSCAVLYPVGATVDPMVLDRHGDGTFSISPCSLVSLDAVRRELGTASPPRPAPPDTPGFAVPSSLVGPGFSWPAVAAGLVVAVLAMAWALRRSGRERVRTDVGELQSIARGAAVSSEQREQPHRRVH
jgi:hypothetical protein